jgi:hypothetical protein
VHDVPGVGPVGAVRAEAVVTRVTVDDGQVARVGRATHGGGREVTLDRLDDELDPVDRSDPLA